MESIKIESLYSAKGVTIRLTTKKEMLTIRYEIIGNKVRVL